MSTRRSIVTIQRVIDGGAAACLLIASVLLVASSGTTSSVSQILTHWGGVVWSVALVIGAAAALAGTILRTPRPGRAQSVGFASEISGWLISGFCVLVYAVAAAARFGFPAAITIGLVTSLGFLLLGKWAVMRAALAAARGET